MSSDDIALRPVAEDDLPVMERFLTDPETAEPFQWFGWWDTGRSATCPASPRCGRP